MKFVEISACSYCPWLKWTAEPRCGNPETLDRMIEETTEVPEWCALSEIEGKREERLQPLRGSRSRDGQGARSSLL